MISFAYHLFNSCQVYNDAQSVHNHNIQESIRTSIYNVLSDKAAIDYDTIINEILNDTILLEPTKKALVEYCNDTSEHSLLHCTFKDLLQPVWNRIQSHIEKDELKRILNTEMSDAICMCFTGRISRLVNVLNGYCDDVQVTIGTNEQIGNVIITIKNKLIDESRYTELLHKELVEKELQERGYEKATIDEWLMFIND